MIYPATLDLTILQGATFAQRFAWKSGVEKSPVDLTGASVRMQVRVAKHVDEVLLEADTASGTFMVEDAAMGIMRIELSPAVTDGLAFRNAVYDIEVELVDGSVYRLLEGRIQVDPQVTR